MFVITNYNNIIFVYKNIIHEKLFYTLFYKKIKSKIIKILNSHTILLNMIQQILNIAIEKSYYLLTKIH